MSSVCVDLLLCCGSYVEQDEVGEMSGSVESNLVIFDVYVVLSWWVFCV